MPLSSSQITAFQHTVLDFYHQHGRHHLPWRTTHATPYHILVSEIMLQQTQVDRVIPKFLSFMEKFPTIEALAESPQSEVIKLWSGLGYNRRARFLWLAAQRIVSEHHGVVPTTLSELVALPGLGPYTSSAILAFAHNKPVTVIETNIRTVYIHHFFPNQELVTDNDLLPIIQTTIDMDNPRQWYAALMDYGSHLKSTIGNLNKKSKTYTKQSKFEGSDRQIRGAILKSLTNQSPQTTMLFIESLMERRQLSSVKINKILRQLEKEKIISMQNDRILLA
jgi:A/G-specific adenine glycosylase